MARTNRIVVDNGIYHITSRIANQEFFLSSPELKGKIATWIYGVADFSGVNVLSWCIMNNHFHLLVHVPNVPKKYWIDSTQMPETTAFTMRPAECNAPRWTPDADDNKDVAITFSGELASKDAVRYAISESVPLVKMARPETGFTMSDDEMIERLRRFEDGHSPRKVTFTRNRWLALRKSGMGYLVDEEKDSYCRRMYNVSQFVKTLKQRISQYYNSVYKHSGQLWTGRFYSGLVDNELKAKVAVAAYIEWNPARAKIVSHAKNWEWCSFGCAMGSSLMAEKARKGYEILFGRNWEEAREYMERIFNSKVEGYNAEFNVEKRSESEGKKIKTQCRKGRASIRRLRITDLIRSRRTDLNGCFISTDCDFGKKVKAKLPRRFKTGSDLNLMVLSGIVWEVVG